MSRPLTIIVGGYIVGYPIGGMTWHHLNYLLGLQEMGHEVWFLEDSGDWCVPYDPVRKVSEADSSYGRGYLEKTFERYGLPMRYCYYSEFEKKHYGLTGGELDALLKRADLMICVSGVTPVRAEWARPRRTVVIDTDPVFTQLQMMRDEGFTNYYRQFDCVATFGRLIGREGCRLPTHGFDWIGTNQPISLRHWPVGAAGGRRFNTVGKWEHSGERNLEFEGKKYRSSKGVEWMKMIELPRKTNWEMSLAMAAMPAEVREEFESRGWVLEEAEPATIDCAAYQRFIQRAAGEFTVAKEIYSGLPSGWFSDRSAAYLASGRPVVTQSSGFERWLPTGEGLFAFNSIEEAAGGLNAIAADYPRHSAAARRIAEEFFDARRVLGQLIERVM